MREDCYVDMIAVDHEGNLVILREEDFRGIGRKNEEWFKCLREINNLEEFIRKNIKIQLDMKG